MLWVSLSGTVFVTIEMIIYWKNYFNSCWILCFPGYGPDMDGWYPPPGFQQNPSRRLNFSNSAALSPSLKSAIVTCPPPPAKRAECGHKDGPCLFNIDKDPCEHTNVANQEKDVLEMMLQLLEKYKKTMVPIRNKPYDHRANPKFHNGLWTAWCDEAPSDKCY